MTDPQHDWWAPAVTIGIAAFAAVWWFVRRLFSAVTREELEGRVNSMHLENVSRLEGIRGDIRSIHERIDDMYRDLIGRKP